MTMDWTRIGVNELTRHALSEERLDIVAYAFPVMAGIAHTFERELETVMTGEVVVKLSYDVGFGR